MKYTLLFLLLPYLAIAQRELLRDSVWLTRQAMYTTTGTTTDTTYQFFQNTLRVYINGESDTQAKLLGDSATALNSVTGQQIDAVRQRSYHVAQVIDNQVVKEWQQMHNQTSAVGIGSMAELIQRLFEKELIGNVRIKTGASEPVLGEIIKAQNGSLRLLIGDKGYRVFVFADTMVRIMGYPVSGQNTELYKTSLGVYKDIDNQVVIRVNGRQTSR